MKKQNNILFVDKFNEIFRFVILLPVIIKGFLTTVIYEPETWFTCDEYATWLTTILGRPTVVKFGGRGRNPEKD
jgi:hypothetical protein